MKRLSCLFAICMLLCASSVFAAPTDIVPQGASSQDWMASLAADGLLGPNVHPSEFTTEPLHTREQFVKILESSILSPSNTDAREHLTNDQVALVRQLITNLRPEFLLDGYDVKTLLGTFHEHVIGGSITVEPELRLDTGGNHEPKSGVYGIYRADAVGTAGRDMSYNLSVSDWYQDWRRDVYNDLGDKDFTPLNEAYIEIQGKHNEDFKIGRMYDRWGAAALGGTMVSDNSPAFDQIEYTKPFSLGAHFGRNWRHTQTVGTFDEGGQRKYFQARSLEYVFSSHWSADYEDSLKSSSASSLLLLPIPYLIGKNLHSNTENTDGTDSNFDLTYSSNPDTRLYGELLIDDIKSPFRGHIFGLSLGNGGYTPQKLGWLVGGTTKVGSATNVTVEYSYANATTYTFHTTSAPWTHGVNDWIALPTGPNEREIYARLSQKIGKATTIALDARDHWRRDNTYPAPTSSQYGIYLTQTLNKHDAIEINAFAYRQDPFPLQPGQPGYPPDKAPLAPFLYSDPGFRARVNQVDVSFTATY